MSCRKFRISAVAATAVVALSSAVAVSQAGPLQVVGSEWRADKPYPEFTPLWYEGWGLKGPDGEPIQYASEDMPLGGYLHAYVSNTGPGTIELNDVLLEGVSLTEALHFSKEVRSGEHPASIHLSKLGKDKIDLLVKAGEPVWFKVDPATIAPGQTAQITIRMRRKPQTDKVEVGLPGNDSAVSQQVLVGPVQPRIVGINFSGKLNEVFLYLRHPTGGISPSKVLIDGQDVSSQTTVGSDKAIEIAPVTIQLKKPLAKGSSYLFQVIYPDGSQAADTIRAWGDDLVYGMWGYSRKGNNEAERVDYFLTDLYEHNINVVMHSYGGDVQKFLLSENGAEHCRKIGMRGMTTSPGNIRNPIYYFLMDEPDAHDFVANEVEFPKRLGVLGQALVDKSKKIRAKDPTTAHLLNIDNTFKPENWYTYAQLADVMCADPYYQEQMRFTYLLRPSRLATMTKPTYVYAVSTICESACSPKPFHVILNSVRHDSEKEPFRFGTPEEKRVELYYAVAAGAKGISYWWYTPYGEFYGCGGDSPDAVKMYTEMGLLGAELRTAGPVIMRSCPAEVPITVSPRMWVRTLLAGVDTLAVIAVNDDIASDRVGTAVGKVTKAQVNVTLPMWLKPRDVFEITYEGIKDVEHVSADGKLTVELGNLGVARMILISADARLRNDLETIYATQFADNVAKLLARGGGQVK